MQPHIDAGVTFTRPSQWLLRISLYGARVGTVYGDGESGFTARDIDFHLIGRGYISAEAAMHACVQGISTVTSLQPPDRLAGRRTA